MSDKPTTRNLSSLRELGGVVRGIDTEARTVTGYASTGNVDRYGEVVEPGAFARDLPRFLSERHLFAANHNYVTWDSEPSIIGRITEGRIDDKGLFITAAFDSDPLAEKWWTKYKSGTLNSFSIGFIPLKWEDRQIKCGDDAAAAKTVRTYTDVELLEISAVPIPANRESIVTNSFDPDEFAGFIERLTDLDGKYTDLDRYLRSGFSQVLAQLGALSARVATRGPVQPARTVPARGDLSVTEFKEALSFAMR